MNSAVKQIIDSIPADKLELWWDLFRFSGHKAFEGESGRYWRDRVEQVTTERKSDDAANS